MALDALQPPTMSTRLLWPFMRYRAQRAAEGKPVDMIEPGPWLVDPEARLTQAEVVASLANTIVITGDPAIGLHAAALVESGDRGVGEHAARGCRTLGEAYALLARYYPLLNEAAELALDTTGARAVLSYRVTRGIPEPAAIPDFVVAVMLGFARRNATVDETGFELRFRQARPGYAGEYERIFTGPIHFGRDHDALVMPRAALDAPMHEQDPGLTRSAQLRAEELLARTRDRATTVGQVRAVVVEHLGSGQVSMAWVAPKLGASVPTLRRRLAAEGATFSGIVEQVRREIAEREVAAGVATMFEIASRLGFSSLSAFDRAFRRWTGVVPSERRGRARAS